MNSFIIAANVTCCVLAGYFYSTVSENKLDDLHRLALGIQFILVGLNAYNYFNGNSFQVAPKRVFPKLLARGLLTFLFVQKANQSIILLWLMVEITHFGGEYVSILCDLLMVLWPL